MAINRQAICDTLFHGSRTPADNIVPPGIDGYEEGAWQYSKYDVEAAKAILDEHYPADADGNRGLELTITSNQDGGHKEVMDSIISDLAAVGISCVADTPDWATVLDRYQKLDYQFGRLGWVADYPIMDNFLYPLFYTGNGDNRAGYSNPTVDEELMAGCPPGRQQADWRGHAGHPAHVLHPHLRRRRQRCQDVPRPAEEGRPRQG